MQCTFTKISITTTTKTFCKSDPTTTFQLLSLQIVLCTMYTNYWLQQQSVSKTFRASCHQCIDVEPVLSPPPPSCGQERELKSLETVGSNQVDHHLLDHQILSGGNCYDTICVRGPRGDTQRYYQGIYEVGAHISKLLQLLCVWQ